MKDNLISTINEIRSNRAIILIETTEKISGFRPEIEDVEKFIMDIQRSIAAKPENSSPPMRPVPVNVLKPKPVTNSEGTYINRRIKRFQLLGKTHHPRTWQELLVLVSEKMYRRHSPEFFRCLSLRGSRMSYSSQQPNELSQPMQIAGSNFFVETKLNSDAVIRRSRELMGLFSYRETDLYVSAELYAEN